MTGFVLGGNLDLIASLDFVAVLDTVSAFEVFYRNARFFSDAGERLTLLYRHLARLLGFGLFFLLTAL